ncbi:YigZ family protein [Virgibacillus phasianinus]|uniref:YigZ family protein n=1 Tax=Virgibacillus phasianinus TaxID=2017483 RepID=A0A220U3N7_9BACI|nr:YigZ family protein [Virgibacillus phasianinus]ASK62717.1 YigZ family protein [Virgibacillus phasianinus]
MLSNYYTIKKEGTNQFIVQKSRFIGHVSRVESEDKAQAFIEEIKKKHHDANHNCSAYIIGEHDQIQKANDDGEPSGTAGVPILEVLKKQKLKDTVIVVTRYFGGIKLGAGGLIRAYGGSASEVIKSTGVVERQLMQGMQLTVDYGLLGKLENVFRTSEHVLSKIDYLDQVIFHMYVRTNDVLKFKEWVVNLTSDNVHIEDKDHAYIEIDQK